MGLVFSFSNHKWWRLLIIILLAGSYPAQSSGMVTICAIQGGTKVSPLAGQEVATEGVVTADFDDEAERGFFMQAVDCDGNAGTSDGIFVYLGTMAEVVSVGDRVTVDGLVEEDFGLTRVNTTPAGVSVISSGQALPEAVEFAPPFDNLQSGNYFEARESMRVQAGSTVVVGPTDARGDTFVVRAGLGIDRVFQTDPAGTGEIIPIGGDGVYSIEPDAQVGDQVFSVTGVLNFTGGNFRIKLTAPPTLIRPGVGVPVTSEVTVTSTPFSIASLNLHNLFDWVDDPNTEDSVLEASEVQRKLKKLALTIHMLGEPLLIAVQEAENGTVLQALANRPEIETQYAFVWEDSPDRRGIDVGLMYRMDRITVQSYEYRQGCTTLVDGLGPDGNGDVFNPVNMLTCDTDGDLVDDGNRLFSRPPLLARVQVCEEGCGGGVREVWVIAVHFKSKSEDTGTVAYTLPRRVLQAQFVAGVYQEVLALDGNAEVFVLGDLNDYPNSQTLAELTGVGLTNLAGWLPPESAYTYIYQGVSQILDQVLVSPIVLDEMLFPRIYHLNADYPVSWEGDEAVPRRASDHDPVLVYVGALPHSIWVPVVMKP